MLLLMVLCAAMAASFTLAKAVLEYAQPIFFVGVRMMLAGILLLMYQAYRDPRQLRITRTDIPLFIWTACAHIYIAFVFDLVALQDMSSFKGSFIYNLSPFLAALFSYHYFGEKMTFKKIGGLLLGLCGFIPELLVQTSAEQSSCHILFLSRAEIFMIISVIASVYGWTLVRLLIKRQYTAIAINGYAMLGGGIAALITSWYTEQWFKSPPLSDLSLFVCYTGAVIVISNILLYNLYGYLLRMYSATFLSFVSALSPVYAALFGWLFLSEVVAWPFYLSMGMVLIGLWIFYSEELRQGYIIKSVRKHNL